jgi:dTDP-4-amino-4,6-dideoxy-D-galactose acyltransferase
MPDCPDDVGQFLEWDSRFFGRRIGRLKTNRLAPNLMPLVESWCRAQRIECLYFLADPNHEETSRLATEHHFQFVDARVTLDLELSPATPVPGESELIRLARATDLPALRQMARRLHHDSRFFFDNRFDPALSERMFEAWIEKSCARPEGPVFVADWAGRPAGYIACRQPQPDLGQVDLLGVDDSAQGNGLGGKLISTALRWFAAQPVRRVQVVTQGRNVRAQRLYQRSGFVTHSVELWYHRWFDRAPASSHP